MKRNPQILTSIWFLFFRTSQERADSPGPSCVSMKRELRGIRSEFVKGVSDPVIKGLLDDLYHHEVFSSEEKDSVMEEQRSRADQARCLIDMVIGKGERASQMMIDGIKERDKHLCINLGLISSLAGVGELLP
uniref:CARD domain-containing protein n=1 Tax=Gadus morhua TaxID=8049 RepID=A0A8C5FCH0_GADMO